MDDHNRISIILFISIIGLFFLAIMVQKIEAETIIVDANGNGDHTTIQNAIYAAKTGDTIKVWEGTYQENIVVDIPIDLVGNGSGVTTIDAGGEGDVVQITADWVNMSGLDSR